MRCDTFKVVQKGFAPLVIIILIALALGGYLVYQKQFKSVVVPQPASQPSPVPAISDDITNWKTYINSEYKYQLQYPKNWNSSVGKFSDSILDSQCFGIDLNKCILNIAIFDENSWDRQKQLLGFTLSSKEGAKEVSFAGLSALKREGYFGENGSSQGFVIIFQNKKKTYRIWAYERTEDKNDFSKSIKQILSTFKFTN